MPKKPIKKSLAKIVKKTDKKRYLTNVREKYMCAKHKHFFIN